MLNASRLELGAASIYSDALKTYQVQSSQVYDTVSERATFHFANALPAGSKAQLKVVFAGPLTGGMTGYYKSAWEDEGKTKHYALTQFEVRSSSQSPIIFSLTQLHSQLMPELHSLAGTNPFSKPHSPSPWSLVPIQSISAICLPLQRESMI